MTALGKVNLVTCLYLSASFFGLSFLMMGTYVNIIFYVNTCLPRSQSRLKSSTVLLAGRKLRMHVIFIAFDLKDPKA